MRKEPVSPRDGPSLRPFRRRAPASPQIGRQTHRGRFAAQVQSQFRRLGTHRIDQAVERRPPITTWLHCPAGRLWPGTLGAGVVPIPKFFATFYPEQGDQAPETVSRHATVHQPTVAHLTRDNSLLAIMLCTPLLREQQDWIEEVRDY